MAFDIICIGGITVDHIYRLSHLPEPGSGTHILGIDKAGGGVEANVAAALARLGARVGLISRVGEDADGMWARDDLKAWGVDVSRVVSASGATTDFCIAWVAPDGERLLACHNPCLRSLRLEEADWALISQAQVLFLSSFAPLELLREAIGTRTSGLTIAFDLTDTFDDLAARGLDREDFWQLLRGIDLLMTNQLGLTSLMGTKGQEVAFSAVRQRAPGVHVAMTMGARGAWLGLDDVQICVDAFPVRALDTIGAGDAFHAGLIYGLVLENWSLRRAGIFASALAALNCTGIGARGGLASRDKVFQFLHDQSEGW